MGVTETLRILLTIFLSMACIQNVRLFGVYDVRWPFLAEIYTVPLKRFVPSSVLQAVRSLRNAPAALAVFLAGVAPVTQSTYWSISDLHSDIGSSVCKHKQSCNHSWTYICLKVMIMIVIAWQRPESLVLGMGFGKIDKVNWNIYVLSQCI